MPQEIERKYLVRLEHWKPTAAGVLYRQGYLSSVKERVVRVRIAGEQAHLTIKGLMRGEILQLMPEFRGLRPLLSCHCVSRERPGGAFRRWLSTR